MLKVEVVDEVGTPWLTFLDDRRGIIGGGTVSGRIADTIEKGRNPAMLYGGLAAIAGGVALAVLSGGAGAPALDVQAGPRGGRAVSGCRAHSVSDGQARTPERKERP